MLNFGGFFEGRHHISKLPFELFYYTDSTHSPKQEFGQICRGEKHAEQGILQIQAPCFTVPGIQMPRQPPTAPHYNPLWKALSQEDVQNPMI